MEPTITHLVYLLLGLANGAVFASLALALVMTYRSSGVINFATGAIGLFAAYEYAFLRQGRLLILIPGLPRTVDLGSEWPLFPAMALALAMAALLGLLLYLLVFRPIRRAAPLAKAVASIGVSVVLTGVMLVRLGTEAIPSPPIFPIHFYEISSVRLSSDRVWFAGTVLAMSLVLGALFKYTRFGLQTRAAASSERGAFISGLSPDSLALANWMLSAGVAGVAGILISPILPLVPAAYTLFIVPALAAAIVGRFERATIAVLAGLAIGMVQSWMTYMSAKYTWLPSSGMADLVPLVLMLVTLVIRATPLPSRGAVAAQQSLGRAPRPKRIFSSAMALGVVALVALALLDGRWRAGLSTSLIFALIGLSVVIVTGYSGQVSLAVLVTAGASAFALGKITTDWNIPFPIAPVISALIASALGVVICLPALRIRGLPVAVVTLSLAVTIESLWFRNNDFVSSSGVNIDGPSLFGIDLTPGSGAAFPRMRFCLIVVAVLVIVACGVAYLRNSRLGSAMLAVRANERSAAASGIDVVRVKVYAFAIGGFVAGLGGALLAYQQGNVTYQSFNAILGLSVFATVYIAGVTSISGGILSGIMGFGGIIYVALNQWFDLSGDWFQVITGLGLIITVIQNPEGIAGTMQAQLEARRERRRRVQQEAAFADAETAVHPKPALGAPLLTVSDVSVRYGAVAALADVSFSVRQGSITGLIGPNGAGKTTLMDAVSGFTPATGEIELDGRRLNDLPPHRRVDAGLGRTFQALELWDDLTVAENVLVGLAASHNQHLDPSAEQQRVLKLLGIESIAESGAGKLSQGQRQLVSIARALVGQPSLLLLDEPAGGLDSTESLWLAERLRDIRDSGVTILLIDHDMGMVLTLCDEICVLDLGVVIASGEPAVVRNDPVVAKAYLGSTHTGHAEAGTLPTADGHVVQQD